ncbi:hypothetical protein NFI00_000201 [Salmonella enterica]|nr:hypothetical protein [Salmonella enterica]
MPNIKVIIEELRNRTLEGVQLKGGCYDVDNGVAHILVQDKSALGRLFRMIYPAYFKYESSEMANVVFPTLVALTTQDAPPGEFFNIEYYVNNDIAALLNEQLSEVTEQLEKEVGQNGRPRLTEVCPGRPYSTFVDLNQLRYVGPLFKETNGLWPHFFIGYPDLEHKVMFRYNSEAEEVRQELIKLLNQR